MIMCNIKYHALRHFYFSVKMKCTYIQTEIVFVLISDFGDLFSKLLSFALIYLMYAGDSNNVLTDLCMSLLSGPNRVW